MPPLAVCSWSLRPDSPSDLVEKVRACGVGAVQLALDPLRTFAWRTEETASRLKHAGIHVLSGMMATKGEDYSTLDSIRETGGLRPDEHWEANLRAAEGCSLLAARLALPLVTFHAGFIPHEESDPERSRLVDRLRAVAEVFAARNVRIALETGQEDAETLASVLAELNEGLSSRAAVGINFDPANMLLYGMGDPVIALRRLLPHVRQIHIKDAVPAAKPGTWGEERPVGAGAVDWAAFFNTLRDSTFDGALVIEREAGEERVADVRKAADLVRSFEF